jgi:hypothetical protein
MTRASSYVSLALVAAIATACSGNKSNPAAPTTPTTPDASVRAIVISGTSASATTFQMTARADLTDGTSKDVTASSRWEVSDNNLAKISANGVLVVLHSGPLEVRATYQQATGSLDMMLSAPQPPSQTFALSGLAQEPPPTPRPLAGVTISLVQGPDTGRSTTTDAFGIFRFASLQPGVIGAEAVKDQDRDVSVLLYPTPPTDANGLSATARCKDASWSWAPTRADACTANGGIAYAVCPGPICQTTVAR